MRASRPFAIAGLLLGACGRRDREPPPGSVSGSASGSVSDSAPGSGAAANAVRLHAIAKLPGAELVIGTERVAFATPSAWYEPAPVATDAPRVVPAITSQLAPLRADGPVELFLGQTPIVVAGEEHHERVLRLAPAPHAIELAGHVSAIATLPGGAEVWQTQDRLRDTLALVDATGVVTPLPSQPVLGPPVTGMSPVRAKLCEAPAIADLVRVPDTPDTRVPDTADARVPDTPDSAVRDGAVAALLVECNDETPVRVVTYRWPGPRVEVERWPSPAELGFSPKHLVMTASSRALVGVTNGRLAIARMAGGRVTTTSHLADVSLVTHAAVDETGAVWTLTMGSARDGRDVWQIARDDAPITVADPSGTVLRPIALAADRRYGIVVVAGSEAERWILSVR